MYNLIIDNKRIDTFEQLQACFKQEEASVVDSTLFNTLRDLFVDDDIDWFLRNVFGKNELADKIAMEIDKNQSAPELMRRLIAAITEVDKKIDFDPLEYVEIIKTDIEVLDDEKMNAVMELKVLKHADVEVECVIKQDGNEKREALRLMEEKSCKTKCIIMDINIEGGLVTFIVGGKKIGEEIPAKDLTFNVKGVNFVMIFIAGATFWMGAQHDNPDGLNYDKYADTIECPLHSVTLSHYYLGETVVTQALWKAIMGSNYKIFNHGDNLPMENVSWEDCRAFLEGLNKYCHDQLKGKVFRFPTEAEWEFAARGGKKSRGYRYGGNDAITEVAWCFDNSQGRPHPVKSLLPNELGLFDMSGNICEWCQDWFGNNYYSNSSPSNPQGPPKGDSRVLRGGCWNAAAGTCRVSHRMGHYPDNKYYRNGLRLCLS